MRTRILDVGFLVSGLVLSAASAAATVRLEDCLAAVAEVKTGQYVKVEFLSVTHQGGPTYELEVVDAEGVEWELMCSALTGRVYEIEREVDSSDDPLFARHARVEEAAARAKAQALYPGTVSEVEYEIEHDGKATYEIDIVDAEDHQFKIEVDAASGEIIEVHVEQWEIGMEPEERVKDSDA